VCEGGVGQGAGDGAERRQRVPACIPPLPRHPRPCPRPFQRPARPQPRPSAPAAAATPPPPRAHARQERVARKIAIEKERLRLLKQLDDFQERLEIEKVERLEREALTLKKVTDATFPMQEAITEERGRRESMLGHLRDEQDQMNELRNKPDAQFKHDLITRMVRATTKGHQADPDPNPDPDPDHRPWP